MSKSKNNRYKKRPGGGRYAALALLAVIVIAVVGYMLSDVLKQSLPAPQVVKKTPLPPLPHKEAFDGATSQSKKTPLPVDKSYKATSPASSARLPDKIVPGTGQMAIIIDDMGSSMQEARSLCAIGVPVTFSIIPGLYRYREVAEFADANGIETMIHIPMQSKGWPGRRLESNGLLVSMDNAALTAHLEEFERDIPKAIGANNHMGSEFTEHEEKMRVVLQSLKGKGLFFIDSVTSPQTVGQQLAREMGMKSGRRNVFLDNEQDRIYIRNQLGQAVRLAKKTGASIVICHPHPVTIKTLAALLPGLERQGITLVSASRLVK